MGPMLLVFFVSPIQNHNRCFPLGSVLLLKPAKKEPKQNNAKTLLLIVILGETMPPSKFEKQRKKPTFSNLLGATPPCTKISILATFAWRHSDSITKLLLIRHIRTLLLLVILGEMMPPSKFEKRSKRFKF